MNPPSVANAVVAGNTEETVAGGGMWRFSISG